MRTPPLTRAAPGGLATVLTTVLAAALGLTAGAAAAAASSTVSAHPAAAPAVNGEVAATVAAGGTLYLGGSFTTVGGAPHRGLAALSASSGAVRGTFQAAVAGDVRALAVSGDGGTLYVGGDFSSVDGQPRAELAAVSATTGALLPWNPGANRPVEALAVGGGRVYVGGRFHSIAGATRDDLAALDPATGALVGAFAPPPPDGPVMTVALTADAGRLYVGGSFHSLGGVRQPHLASVDASSGARTGWAPLLPCPAYALARAAGGRVVVGCAGGKTRGNSVEEFAGAAGGQRSALWVARGDGNVQAVAVLGDGTIVAGGHFGTVSGQTRHHLVALSAGGALLGWSPRANSAHGVFTLATAGGSLWAGGDFTLVNGDPHPHLVRFPIG